MSKSRERLLGPLSAFTQVIRHAAAAGYRHYQVSRDHRPEAAAEVARSEAGRVLPELPIAQRGERVAIRLARWTTSAFAGMALFVTGLMIGHGAGNASAVLGLLCLVVSSMWHLESRNQMDRRA